MPRVLLAVLLTAILAACQTTATHRSTPRVPLPLPGFTVDHTRTDPARPTRPRGKPYKGPIVDTHVHLDPTGPDGPTGDAPIRGILERADAEGIERLIVMPTPNEGRFANHEAGPAQKRRFLALGGAGAGTLCGGSYLTVWMHEAYRNGYSAADLKNRMARLAADLDGEECLGAGEIGPYHFNKKGHQAVVDFPMNFEPFLRAVQVTAEKGKWFDLHAEPVEPQGRTREDEVFGGIALLFARHPDLRLIMSHTAMTNPTNARRLLAAYPTLMMNFKIVRGHGGWRNLEPIVDADGNIYADWAALFEAFPERFMIASDAKFARQNYSGKKYSKEIKRLRRLLGTLDITVADMIAHGNARRLFAKQAAQQNFKPLGRRPIRW